MKNKTNKSKSSDNSFQHPIIEKLLGLKESDLDSEKELRLRKEVVVLLEQEPVITSHVVNAYPNYANIKEIAISATSGNSTTIKFFSKQLQQDPDIILNCSCEGSFNHANGLNLIELSDLIADNFVDTTEVDTTEEKAKQAQTKIMIRKALSHKSVHFHNESLTILNNRMTNTEFVYTDIWKECIGDTLEFFSEESLSRADIQSKSLLVTLSEEKQRRSTLKIKLKTKDSNKNPRRWLSV